MKMFICHFDWASSFKVFSLFCSSIAHLSHCSDWKRTCLNVNRLNLIYQRNDILPTPSPIHSAQRNHSFETELSTIRSNPEFNQQTPFSYATTVRQGKDLWVLPPRVPFILRPVWWETATCDDDDEDCASLPALQHPATEAQKRKDAGYEQSESRNPLDWWGNWYVEDDRRGWVGPEGNYKHQNMAFSHQAWAVCWSGSARGLTGRCSFGRSLNGTPFFSLLS